MFLGLGAIESFKDLEALRGMRKVLKKEIRGLIRRELLVKKGGGKKPTAKEGLRQGRNELDFETVAGEGKAEGSKARPVTIRWTAHINGSLAQAGLLCHLE